MSFLGVIQFGIHSWNSLNLLLKLMSRFKINLFLLKKLIKRWTYMSEALKRFNSNCALGKQVFKNGQQSHTWLLIQHLIQLNSPLINLEINPQIKLLNMLWKSLKIYPTILHIHSLIYTTMTWELINLQLFYSGPTKQKLREWLYKIFS